MTHDQDPTHMNGLNTYSQPFGDPISEHINAKGVNVKALHIKQLELEFHNLINEIMISQGFKTSANAVRWALKRATGRI